MPAPPTHAQQAVNKANQASAAASRAASPSRSYSSVNSSEAASKGKSGMSGTGTTSSGTTSRDGSSSGYGSSRPASSSVNAAAARAGMMNDQRQAGITQSNGADKGNFGGANQVVSKGVNLSAADLQRGGYNSYQSPATALSNGRVNQVVNKGVNLSSGDLLAGGYGQYRQAPVSAPGGLMGLQTALNRANPSMGSIVAGDPQARFGTVSSNGEIGSMMGPAGEGVFNRAMTAMLPKAPKDPSRVPSVNSPVQTAAAGYRDYDPMSSITTGNGPTPVATNPARAFPSRPTAPTQTASYDPLSSVQRPAARPVTVADVPQLPGGASTIQKGVTPSMADITQTFMSREPAAYTQQPQVASYQNPARAFPSRPAAPAPARTTFTQALLDKGFTGQGLSPSMGEPTPASAPAPRIALSSPNPAAQRAWNIQRARDAAPPTQTVDGSLYGDAPQSRTTAQRIADAITQPLDKKTAGARRTGDKINRAMGGSDYNDLYGTASQRNPNARDPMNSSSEKIRTLVKNAGTGDPQAIAELKLKYPQIARILEKNNYQTPGTTTQQTPPWFTWNQWAPGSKPGLI